MCDSFNAVVKQPLNYVRSNVLYILMVNLQATLRKRLQSAMTSSRVNRQVNVRPSSTKATLTTETLLRTNRTSNSSCPSPSGSSDLPLCHWRRGCVRPEYSDSQLNVVDAPSVTSVSPLHDGTPSKYRQHLV